MGLRKARKSSACSSDSKENSQEVFSAPRKGNRRSSFFMRMKEELQYLLIPHDLRHEILEVARNCETKVKFDVTALLKTSKTEIFANVLLKRLVEALCGNTYLTEVDLTGLEIGPEGAAALSHVLGRTCIRILRLDCTNCGDEGAIQMARVLAENNSELVTLSMGGNRIGPQGAFALAKALNVNKGLRTLSLLGNSLGDEGAMQIARLLSDNVSDLDTLALGGNGVGPKGAAALAEALAVNQSLQILSLAHNPLEIEGVRVIADALCKNESLLVFHLSSVTGIKGKGCFSPGARIGGQ
ncbi:MAG: hypothetical protein K0Q74_588 [Gammaproteobacteria bacterium]|jgi:hypothetical protein|nr:hypothetical protein [Gammaproteobacteria bacterium]